MASAAAARAPWTLVSVAADEDGAVEGGRSLDQFEAAG